MWADHERGVSDGRRPVHRRVERRVGGGGIPAAAEGVHPGAPVSLQGGRQW